MSRPLALAAAALLTACTPRPSPPPAPPPAPSSPAAAQPPQAPSLTLRLAVIAEPQGGAPETLAPGARVHPGTRLHWQLDASHDAHVYVAVRGSDGALFAAFPSPDHPQKNPLPGGQTLTLPARDARFSVAPVPGHDDILVIASPTPLPSLDEAFERLRLGGSPARPLKAFAALQPARTPGCLPLTLETPTACASPRGEPSSSRPSLEVAIGPSEPFVAVAFRLERHHVGGGAPGPGRLW